MKDIGVIAIFKDEDQIIHEWVDHYKRQGITEILLINHESCDGGEERAKQMGCRIVNYSENPRPGFMPQDEAYAKFIQTMQSEWIAILDLDEFLYADNEAESLASIVNKIPPNVDQITVPWKCFGDSGLEKQPISVISSFTYRGHPETRECWTAKCIVRRKNTLSPRHHFSRVIGKTIEKYPGLSLNHYRSQTWEWYSRVKMCRGDATRSQEDIITNIPWLFKSKDNFSHLNKGKVIYDDILAKRSGSWRERGLPEKRNWPNYIKNDKYQNLRLEGQTILKIKNMKIQEKREYENIVRERFEKQKQEQEKREQEKREQKKREQKKKRRRTLRRRKKRYNKKNSNNI